MFVAEKSATTFGDLPDWLLSSISYLSKMQNK